MVMAKQLAETESLLASFGGEEGSVIISERNTLIDRREQSEARELGSSLNPK